MTNLEQYLRDHKPELPEEGTFLVETNARLNQVEGIKRCVDADRRRGRLALIIALSAGIVMGGVAVLLTVLYPIPDMEVHAAVFDKILAVLQKWHALFIVLIAGCTIALGVVFISRKQHLGISLRGGGPVSPTDA